jgi:hypothetical protein
MTALAGVAALGGTIALDCSRSGPGSDGAFGYVNVALMIAPGIQLEKVHYVIHAGAPSSTADAEGDINTSDPSATPSTFVVFPASTGDTVTLSGDTIPTSTQPSIHCQGQTTTTFDVHVGQNVEAAVSMLCGGGAAAGTSNNGNVHINGTVSEAPGTGDNCPQVSSWTVSPLETSVGGAIDVTADAIDADPGETATLVYAWAPADRFATATGTTNTYRCLAPGPDTITLTVTDAHKPVPCTETLQFAVTCVGAGGT